MTPSSETEILHLLYAGTTEPEASETEAGNGTPSLWRSLGRRFNYESWPERQRFIELDRAIAATANCEREDTELHGLAESVDKESLRDSDAVCALEDGESHLASFQAAAA